MARQAGILPFSGKLDNQIGYRRGKHYFLRQAPVAVKQTAATKRAARDFGTASKCSRIFRHALRETQQHCYDSTLNNRLNKVFGEIVRADTAREAGHRIPLAANMDLLQGFQLNNAADIRHYCNTAPAIEKDEQHISITIPEILFRNAKAFHGITHLAIRAIALSVDFAQENTCQQTSETITIRRGEAQTPFTLTLPAPPEEEITFILLEVQPLYALNGQLQTALHKQGYALGIITILPPTAHPQEIRKVYRNRIPSFWTIPPYPQPTRPSTVIQPVSFSSLPEG